MTSDFRFAWRMLRKQSGPALVAGGGLAVAIGVVTAVFSLINASMLRPYGMDDPSSVVVVAKPGEGWSKWPYRRYLQLREGSSLVSLEASLGATVRFSTNATDGEGRKTTALFVSGGYLSQFGGRTTRGRSLEQSDNVAGAPVVVLISERIWDRDFESSPSVVGQQMWLNGHPVTIGGVMKRGFTGPERDRPDFWLTFASADDVLGGPPFDDASPTEVRVLGRLASGAAIWTAQEQLEGAARRMLDTSTRSSGDLLQLYPSAAPIDDPSDPEASFTIAGTFAALAILLGLACLNAAHLLMASASTRAREIGVRRALGASSRRIIRQMLCESLLLSAIAGAFGFLLSLAIAPALRSIVQLPEGLDLSPDLGMFFFVMGVVAFCAIGCGLSPARFGARGHLLAALQSHSGSRAPVMSSGLRKAFVGIQAAASVLLLVIAVTLARTAITRTAPAVGFEAGQLLVVTFDDVPSGVDASELIRSAQNAVQTLSGVTAVSTVQAPMLSGFTEHRRTSTEDRNVVLLATRADAAYPAAIGLQLIRGRLLTNEDATAESVAMVSASGARALFGGADPIGRRVSHWTGAGKPETATVVGVVSDTIIDRLHRVDSEGAIYRPLTSERNNAPALIVRGINPPAIVRTVEGVIQRLNPAVRPSTYLMQDRLDVYLSGQGALAWLMGPVALLALLLAGFGTYGIASFVASQRSDEVGVRLAIGATPADIRRLLVRDSMRPVAAGMVFGVFLAVAITPLLSMPLAISRFDPVALLVAVATLLAGAVAAVIGPARRAARLSPASFR